MLPSLRWVRTLLLILSLVFFFSPSGSAQILNVTDSTSTPVPGVGHDYIKMLSETVNPANGSVSLRISVPMPTGRKLALPFSFDYDSNGAAFPGTATIGGYQWLTNSGVYSNNGWSYSVPMLTEVVHARPALIGQNVYYCYYSTDYVFQDASGGRHQMPVSMIINPNGPGCQGAPLVTQLTGGDNVYKATLNASGYAATVVDPDGTVYSFPITMSQNAGTYSYVPSSIEDRNGNVYTVTGVGGALTYKDTLGRTALSASGFGSSGNTVSVSGLTGNYTVTWGTISPSGMPVNSNLLLTDGSCPTTLGSYIAPGPVIKSIELPNNYSYQFSYDSVTGLLSSITYPTGEKVTYTWALNSQSSKPGWRSEFGVFPDSNGVANQCEFTYGMPAVSERKVYFDGVTLALDQKFTYNTTWSSTNNYWSSKTATVTTTDDLNSNDPNFVTSYTYAYFLNPGDPDDWSLFAGQLPVESQVVEGTLRTTNKSWNDVYTMSCQQVALGGGSFATTLYTYGNGDQLKEKDEYDYGSSSTCSSPGNLLRKTTITYNTFGDTPLFPNGAPIYDRPSSVVVYDGSGNKKAETDYAYDGGSLASSGVQTGHDSSYSTSMTVRGNATTKTQKCLYNCSSDAVTTYGYDDTGQMVSLKDPNTNVTDYYYTDSFASGCGSAPGTTNAYLTKIQDPKNFTQTFTYRYCDGQLASATDRNSQTTNYSYVDSLARLTEVSDPDGGTTTHTYDDGSPTSSIVTSQTVHSSTTYTTTQVLDGAGHVTRTQLNTDPDCAGGADNTDTVFDGLGRPLTVSNPYCSANPDPHSTGVTTYVYDAISRVTSAAAPDGSTTNTSYSGDSYTVTDPRLSARTISLDALGRMNQVVEDPSGLNYSTAYTYDALNNLLTATQGSQTRTFAYDSLSRLYTAQNPEVSVGSTHCLTTYGYDGNGNMTSRLAPLPNQNSSCTTTVTSTYAYDSLNRVTSKSYNDGTTPSANFCYDESSVALGSWTSPNLAYPKGRLTHTTTLNSSGTTLAATVQDYDRMGRTADYWQCTPANCGTSPIWSSNFLHKFTGEVYQWTHPAGYTLQNPISAARRITAIQSSWVDANHPQYPAQSINYMPWGALSKFVNGCAGSSGAEAQETYLYNNHLQTAVIELGTTANNTADYCLVYDYYGNGPASCGFPSSGTNNNGNVMGYWYQDSVNPSTFSHAATYAYDHANRLTNGASTGNATYNLTFSYTQDGSTGQYGNMTCVTNGQTVGTCTNLSFNAVNNQITSSGYSYDAAGNMTRDSSNLDSHTYQWDAEGRVASVDGGTTWSFTYNALGDRVQWSSSGGTAQQFFDPEGGWLGVAGSYSLVRFGDRHMLVYSGSDTQFNHVNALGSTSVMTNHAGTAVEDMLFYPWGDVWQTWGGGGYNFAYMPYNDVNTTTNLTTARIMSPNFGRWFSPDPAGRGAVNLEDPQTWNMYAYAGNNPTTNTDPTGETYHVCQTDANGNQSNCTDISDEQFGQFQQENKDTLTFTGNGNVFQNGTVIGSYEQTSVDLSPFASGVIAGVNANRPGDFIAGVAGASVIAGSGVGLGLYATSAGAGLTTLGLQAAPAIAPLLPLVPSAIAKLQQLGISLQEAAEIVSSPTAQKFIDNANGGNINVLQDVGGKIIRITLDPTASRIISAGIVQARNVTNSIASGRFTPMQ